MKYLLCETCISQGHQAQLVTLSLVPLGLSWQMLSPRGTS